MKFQFKAEKTFTLTEHLYTKTDIYLILKNNWELKFVTYISIWYLVFFFSAGSISWN